MNAMLSKDFRECDVIEGLVVAAIDSNVASATLGRTIRWQPQSPLLGNSSYPPTKKFEVAQSIEIQIRNCSSRRAAARCFQA